MFGFFQLTKNAFEIFVLLYVSEVRSFLLFSSSVCHTIAGLFCSGFTFVFICGCTGSQLLYMGSSLVALSRAYSLLAEHRFLITVVSFSGAQARGTQASVAAAHGPCGSTACVFFPDQGLKLHWQVFITEPPGKPSTACLLIHQLMDLCELSLTFFCCYK